MPLKMRKSCPPVKKASRNHFGCVIRAINPQIHSPPGVLCAGKRHFHSEEPFASGLASGSCTSGTVAAIGGLVYTERQSFGWRLLTLKWSSLSARAVYTASRTSFGPVLHWWASLHCADGHASLSSRLVIISSSAGGLYLWYGHHCWLRSYGFAGSTWSPWYQSSLWGHLSGYGGTSTSR